MKEKDTTIGQAPIRDARTLGAPRMLVLGLQHMFAMFGATVLVPILVQSYGLPLSIDELVLEGLLSTVRAQMERDSDPEEAENGKPKQS